MSVYRYQDKDIYYEITGEISKQKKVILILNGIMMNVRSWDIFVDSFTKNNILLRVDMFDQGLSHKMEENYTQELQVDMLKGLLDSLDIKTVNIVGISYGASVALQFAVKYPNCLESIVVANGVAKTSNWLKAIGEGWNLVGKTRNGEAYYNISIPYIYSPRFYENNIKWMEDRKKVLIPIFSNETFLDAMERLTISSYTHNVLDSLEMMDVKTMIISSKEDFLTPPFEQRLMHSKIPNSTLVEFDSCGHASMYEKPKLFTSTILSFINNI